jgi:ABC-type bacteriocin/lantibiotic exporter with double-glycine peptidase domain
LLARFEQGLETKVTAVGDGISLGQKQLIAFMRAVLRDPEILVLDEATANIDTVTEQLLEQILAKLPPSTTKVIIAHRLNTIANADEIFFINWAPSPGRVDGACMDMLLRESGKAQNWQGTRTGLIDPKAGTKAIRPVLPLCHGVLCGNRL